MTSRTPFTGRSLPIAFLCAALAAPTSVIADHHEKETPPDPVVGGLMLTDPDAFKTAIATGYRASDLLGTEVFNDSGEEVGNVDDIIVGSDLKVSLAVLSVGGFLGVGSRLVAIPTREFDRGANGELVLNGATPEALMALPEFRFME